MTAEIFAIMAPIFVVAGLGYGWARLGRDFDTDFVTNIVLTFATPCLVFASLTTISRGLADLGTIAIAMLFALVSFAVLGFILLRAMGGLPAHSYLPALIFGNQGNMGLPLAFFAFGEAGLGLAVTAFAVHSILQFTAGVSLAAGTANVRQLLRAPVLWGVIASLPFMFSDLRPPVWIGNTVTLLGGLVIPLMLLTLGVSLSRLRITRIRRSVAIAAARLIGGLAVGLVVAEVFSLEGIVRGVLIIQTAMPVAIFNYVFAQRYQREPEDIAAAIVISTLASILTLPLVLALVL